MAGTSEVREYLEIRGHLFTRGVGRTSRKATLPVGGLKDGKWWPLSEDICLVRLCLCGGAPDVRLDGRPVPTVVIQCIDSSAWYFVWQWLWTALS